MCSTSLNLYRACNMFTWIAECSQTPYKLIKYPPDFTVSEVFIMMLIYEAGRKTDRQEINSHKSTPFIRKVDGGRSWRQWVKKYSTEYICAAKSLPVFFSFPNLLCQWISWHWCWEQVTVFNWSISDIKISSSFPDKSLNSNIVSFKTMYEMMGVLYSHATIW